MIDVERFERQTTLRLSRGLKQLQWTSSILAIVAVCSSMMTIAAIPSGASSTIANDKAKAAVLYKQIQDINGRVGRLGQKYDQAHVKLEHFNNQIKHTKQAVAAIERNLVKGNNQLRADAIFAYVTNGSAASNNPLFSNRASKIGATNVYNQLAEGNISTTLAGLKNYKIELTQERSILRSEDRQAADAERVASKAFRDAQNLQRQLQAALRQVSGQIATYIHQQEVAAQAKAAGALSSARPSINLPAPPPNRRAAIAIRAALSYLGVPYVWGGASRHGVDCSGLIMLAYAAAGVFFPHYSGAQYADTVRVPLYDIQPGDLLFYGYDGDQHVAMYIGHDEMIEAPYTGSYVHITPVRLGYGFAGIGRPRV